MPTILRTLFAALLAVVIQSANAGEAGDQALLETQQVLTNPTSRGNAIANDPAARNADKQLRDVAGNPQRAEAIYGLAADMMSNLTSASGGDPDKMDTILQGAAANPESFLKSMTPEQRKKLREIASEIEGPPKP